MDVDGRTVVIVDDGLATGATARVAVQVVRAMGARRIVLAVPVAPPEAVPELEAEADRFVTVVTPSPFFGVGQWYEDFGQTSDDEVAALLRQAGAERAPETDSTAPGLSLEVEIPVDGVALEGFLDVPPAATGVVLFAHGSGSSRHSPRNQVTADSLRSRGFGTLLFDLLTPAESTDRRNVFDIELLADRLLVATRWLRARGGHRSPAPRVLRGQHRRRCRTPGGCSAGQRRRRRRVAGWPAGPGRGQPPLRAVPDPAHRRWSRCRGHRAQPECCGPAPLPVAPRHRPGGDPPLRGARGPGRGGPVGGTVVRTPPRASGPGVGDVSEGVGVILRVPGC